MTHQTAVRALGALTLLLSLGCSSWEREEFQAPVTEVIAGDLLEVERDGRPVKVRLAGVACPERGQPYRSEARQHTVSLTQGRAVTVRTRGRTREGHRLGLVILPGGQVLNRVLVAAGLAWRDPDAEDSALEALEAQARDTRAGLWAEPSPTPPWTFRRGKSWRDHQ